MKYVLKSYYSLTIDDFQKKGLTFEYLEEVIKEYQLRENIEVVHTAYEISDRGTKHLHLLVIMRHNVYKKRLTKKGISTKIDYLETVRDVDRWTEYIFKSIPPYERCNEFLEQHNLMMRLNQNRILL